MRESVPTKVDKKSRVPKEEIAVWNSQEGGNNKCIFFSLHSLVLVTQTFFFFSLSQELMITQQTTQFKLCTEDYITTMYPA